MTRQRYKRKPRILRRFLVVFFIIVLYVIEMALIVAMTNLNSTETFLAWLIAVLAAIQLFGMFISIYRAPDEYEFVPVEDGKIAEYFSEGEPNERLQDGWEVHVIATEGVLFKR